MTSMRFFVPALLLLATACADPEWPPDEAVAAMNAGLVALEDDRAPESVPHFERALALAPEWQDARVNLAVARFHSGNLTSSLLDAVLAGRLGDPRGLFLAGVQERMAGESDRAADRFRDLVSERPDDAHAWCWLGLSLKDAGRSKDAIPALERALQLDGDLRPAKVALSVLRGNPPGDVSGRPIRGAYVFWGPHGRAVRRFRDVDTRPPPGDRWLVVDLVPGTPPGTMDSFPPDPDAPCDCRMEIRSGRHFRAGWFTTPTREYRLAVGNLETVDYLRIRWPSGRLTAHGPYDTNQTITLRESEQ